MIRPIFTLVGSLLLMQLAACRTLPESPYQAALTAAEIRSLIEGRTYTLISMKTGKVLLVYSDKTECTMRYIDGTRLKTQPWHIKDNQHCCVDQGREKCGEIFAMGRGVFHKVDQGRHTHIMRDFRQGNQL